MIRVVFLSLAIFASVQTASEETRLGRIPEGLRLAHRPCFDAEGRNVVWSAVVGERMWLYVGETRRAGPFDCVCSPSVSARNGRIAFAGIRDGRRYAFIDGEEGVPYDYVTIPVVLSHDGSSVAFAASRKGRSFVVWNGKPGPDFDDVRAPVLSPDGKRIAYAAQRSGAWTVVVGERPGRFQDFVVDPVFSADGGVVAYSNGFEIVVDEKVLGPFEGVTPLALSADGRIVAYGRKSGGRWSVVVNGTPHPIEGDLERVFLSPDGSRFGGVSLRDRKYSVIVDGRAGGAFDQIDPPCFSADGRRWGYAAREGATWSVVVNEHEFGPYGDAGSPTFSADGRHVSFGARRSRELLWVTRLLP